MSVELFSYSKLDTYIQCSFKYKLRYVDGHYVSGSSIATEFGTLLHSIEETIANNIKAGEPINYVALKNTFLVGCMKLNAKYPKDFITYDKSDRTYRDKMYFYLNTGIYRLEKFMKAHPTYEIVGAEIPFSFEASETYGFKGFIDRVIRDTATGEYIIQDIKSYAVPLEHSKLVTPLQFVVYTIAAEKIFGCDKSMIKCSYDLPLCDIIQEAGTAGYVDRGTKKISSIFEKIAEMDFHPTPSPLCHWCEFCPTNPNQPAEGKGLCPYYSMWTQDNKINKPVMRWEGLEAHGEILQEYLATIGA